MPEPIRVLHVDDQADFADLTVTALEREDDRLSVEAMTSGDEVLERLTDGVDCVVSDYDMPGRNGIEVLEAIRERYPDLPFILFTGKGSEEVASEAISAGVTDYLQKAPGSEQYEILLNRIVNAVEAARTRARAARQERINTLIRETNRRLVAADTVDDIESAVCRTLTNAAPFRFAWIGDPDESGEVVPRTSAGDAADYLDEVTIYHDDRPRGLGPGGRAIRTGALQVAQNIPDDPSFEPWHDVAERYGYESVAVVPLSYGGGRTGILAIYADCPHAFDELERSVLEELGKTISRALEAAETRRRLESRRTAERGRKERHYRTLVDTLPNGAIAMFETDLHYTVVGGAVFDDLDLSPGDMEGKALTAVHSAAFCESHLQHYRAVLDGAERTFEFEYAGHTFEAHVAPVRDETGSVDGGIAMTQDVTERVQRQRELRRRERILRETYEVIADPSLSVEEGVRRLLAVGADVLDVRYGILSRIDGEEYVFEVVHGPDEDGPAEGDTVALAATNCERVVRTGETITVADVNDEPDADARTPDTEFDLSCYVGAPVVIDGETDGTFCFYDTNPRDGSFSEWEVTLVDLLSRWVGVALDRHETNARLRMQNERVREFTSIVSHDLRNPLTVLGGALELAEATGEAIQFDRCRRAVERMEALVEDLTTLTREGAVVTDTEPVALGWVVRACWETVDTGAAELRLDGDATIPADEARLRQLLENLFRNSVEHGAAGGRSGDDAADATPLTVRIGVLDDGFYVVDDGVGIPKDERDRVFERGHSTTPDGTGLGLSIVEKMAAAHGWTVGVSESEAGGARIDVRGVEIDGGSE